MTERYVVSEELLNELRGTIDAYGESRWEVGYQAGRGIDPADRNTVEADAANRSRILDLLHEIRALTRLS